MEQNLKSLINLHKKMHPSMHAQDVYKMLYQGTMGPHHLIENQNAARSFLQREFEELELQKDDENLMESVSIGGTVVRINLRVFKRFGQDTGALFSCMLASAKQMVPDEKLLRSLWNEFKELNGNQLLHFIHQEVVSLDERLATEGFKAIRHSKEYRLQERPAYRVVFRECYEEMSGLPQSKCN